MFGLCRRSRFFHARPELVATRRRGFDSLRQRFGVALRRFAAFAQFGKLGGSGIQPQLVPGEGEAKFLQLFFGGIARFAALRCRCGQLVQLCPLLFKQPRGFFNQRVGGVDLGFVLTQLRFR